MRPFALVRLNNPIYYLRLVGGGKRWIHAIIKSISEMLNAVLSSIWTWLTEDISYHCTIARYGYVWNTHRMSITYIHKEHRNLETWKTLTTSQFRYETFYYLWVKGFDIRREAQSFYAGFSICPSSRAAPVACKFVWPLRAPKVGPSRPVSSFQLN